MWYVFGATGVALTGIGNGTLKRGTLAYRRTSSSATPGAARSKTPGSAAPAAAPAPIPRNSFLDIRLFAMGCLLLPPQNNKNRPLLLCSSRLHYWLYPSSVPNIYRDRLLSLS